MILNKNMGFQKISGWFLLIAGLAILGWTIYSTFNIFTAKDSAPQIFKIENKAAQSPANGAAKIPTTPTEIQKQMENIVSQQIAQTIPIEVINNLLNMIVWVVFATFLVVAGFYIGSLGIKLLK